MDDSDDDLFAEDDFDMSSFQYVPKPIEPNKKDVKESKASEKANETARKMDAKRSLEMQKQMIKANKPVKNKKEVVSSDEDNEKRKLIVLMSYYFLEFPEELKRYKKINLDKKSFEELVELHKQMKITLGNESNILMGVSGMCGAIEIMETLLVNFSPINCSGISDIVCKDPETIKLMKLITLKNCSIIDVEPEQRLIFKLVMTTIKLHTKNSTSLPIHNNEDIIKKLNSENIDI